VQIFCRLSHDSETIAMPKLISYRRFSKLACVAAAGLFLAGCGNYETTLPHGSYMYVGQVAPNVRVTGPVQSADISDPIASQPDPMTAHPNPLDTEPNPMMGVGNDNADPMVPTGDWSR
jgi:hypothetical protein